MRSVRMAIWTYGEPVSPSCVLLASMTAVFSVLVIMVIHSFLYFVSAGAEPGGKEPLQSGQTPDPGTWTVLQ